ncbi:MAG: pantoate--beta-alanine ligase [Flavobacteriales bacterium]|nr:pantoate--beta-alanine ligase [Flavobacteriales bacterium]MCC6938011.1 pantoate--beta-alanine ligase [Flavobacteriales bacterium]
MKILTTPEHAVEWSAQSRLAGRSIGFVPTMGALHEGHLDLVRRARTENGVVVCSIFINPLQFNDAADLARYPVRTTEDRSMLEKAGCDALFSPRKEELFAGFSPSQYDLGGLDEFWEGPSRPGHFQGVVNVVERLFHFVRPDSAYFGEKDRQQLHILHSVADRYRWAERIIACQTVRESDGLALSSRNLRLNASDRSSALALVRALRSAADTAWTNSVSATIDVGAAVLRNTSGVIPDYFGIAHPETLAPLSDWGDLSEAIALVAAQVGPVRLIDNITLTRPA